MYMAMKHLHLTAVALTILFFITRFIWKQIGSPMSDKKWVKILPHVIDTVLLTSAIALCIIVSRYPFIHAWVTFKLLAVIGYIILGLIALKKAQTKAMQWTSFVLALILLGATAKVAILKQPLFF